MKKVKQMGIWMDHSMAYLMEFVNDNIVETLISSELTQQGKEKSLEKSEAFMHNKEQQLQASYYKKLIAVIRDYQDVILFGPTEAKNELANLLKGDHLFDSVKIEVKNSDKMSAIQMHTFVKEYFK
jgi:hypothetical protein